MSQHPAFVKHAFPGFSRPLVLPETIPVSVQLISSSVAGWTSGQKANRVQDMDTWHDTGNDDSDADGDYAWAAGGGRVKIPGSYNGIFDGTELIITQRGGEMVGHAANTQGNNRSIAFEQAYGSRGGGFEASWEVGCWVHAGAIVMLDRQVDTALVQHHFWIRSNGTQKDCPHQIRARNRWSRTVSTVTERAAMIRAFLAGADPGKPTSPGWPYPKPIIIPELAAVAASDEVAPFFIEGAGARWTYLADRVRVIKPTPRYLRADRSSGSVGPDLKVGEEFDLEAYTNFNGEDWGVTPGFTRIPMECLQRISDAKGAKEAA